ncbi:MAG: hypothetical protein GC162_19335 [Planctomycetes bacterium]|nr:hypothetical protein [Planctomycetota bacterium]
MTLERSIALPGVEGRIDHLFYDPASHRLFVAALGNDTIEVIDAAAGQRIATLKDLRTPTGMVVDPQTRQLFAAAGGDGRCHVYDADLKPVATIGDLDDADNVRFDPAARRVYIGYGDGALAVIDPDRRVVEARIKLDGHPESFQLESQGERIFVNVPSAGHIAVIDRQKHAVIATWPVKAAASNFPMALDDANHRLIVACRRPAKLLVLDTQSGKVVADVACVGDADDVYHDAARRRVYVSGGAGRVDVFEQTDADTYRLHASIPTEPGARTSKFVPELARLFVAIPHRGAQAAELRVFVVHD